MENKAYLLGQLLTVLISDGWADVDDQTKVVSNFRGTFAPCIARALQSGGNGHIGKLVADIGEIPVALTAVEQSSFWLGFYHRKRGPGRPAGTTKPEDERLERFTVRMTKDEWSRCLAKGNASEYIRGLIAKDAE